MFAAYESDLIPSSTRVGAYADRRERDRLRGVAQRLQQHDAPPAARGDQPQVPVRARSRPPPRARRRPPRTVRARTAAAARPPTAPSAPGAHPARRRPPPYTRATSKTPSPRSSPSSSTEIDASSAGITTPSRQASTARSLQRTRQRPRRRCPKGMRAGGGYRGCMRPHGAAARSERSRMQVAARRAGAVPRGTAPEGGWRAAPRDPRPDAPAWNRTKNLRIKSPLLCQLSYRGGHSRVRDGACERVMVAARRWARLSRRRPAGRRPARRRWRASTCRSACAGRRSAP